MRRQHRSAAAPPRPLCCKQPDRSFTGLFFVPVACVCAVHGTIQCAGTCEEDTVRHSCRLLAPVPGCWMEVNERWVSRRVARCRQVAGARAAALRIWVAVC